MESETDKELDPKGYWHRERANKELGELIVKYKCQWLQTTHPFNLLEVNIVDPELKCFSFALFLH